MSRELLDRVHAVIQSAETRGAQGVRAAIGRNRNSRVEWLDGKLDRLRESTTMNLSVTLYVDGRYSASSTSDLRPEAIEDFLDDIVSSTRLLAEDPHRKLPDPSRYADPFEGDLGQYDPDGAASLTGIERRRMVAALEDGTRSSEGAEKIVSVKASVSDNLYETVMAASNGMEGSNQGTSFSLFVRATVNDEGDRKQMDYWYDACLLRDKQVTPESVGQKALRRALAKVGAYPRPTGEYDCIIERNVAERALGGLLQPLNGGAIQQQQSFLADKMGEQVASPLLTMLDEPHLVGGFGSARYDGEGMATRPMPIFEKGVLRNFYLDTYYASKLEMEATTGSSTNLILTPGDRDLDALLQAMGTGILITGFVGGNSNPTTGDFSIGVEGQWVENGRLVHPISEMNLSGNHLQSWKQLAELGNDPFLISDVRCPSMRFTGLQFSGA